MTCDYNEKESIGFCGGPCKPCNVRRAEKAADVLDYLEKVYGTDENELNVSDFLADLMHYEASTSTLDIDAAVNRARTHFEEENNVN